jgi:hypothetical protein
MSGVAHSAKGAVVHASTDGPAAPAAKFSANKLALERIRE